MPSEITILAPTPTSTPVSLSQDETIRIVAIALDESAFSEYAFKFALQNIIHKSDMVILLNVRSIPTTPSPFSGMYFDASFYLQDLENESRLVSHSLLKYYSSILKFEEIAHKAIALRGDPREEILRKVDELDVKMIVMGSRGLNAFKRTFIGSVSDYIIHSVDIPIIVVKHPNPEQLEKYCKHSTEALVVRTKRNEQRIEKDKLLKKKLEHDKLLFEQTKANSSDRKGLNKQMDEEIFSDLESKAEIEFKRKDTDTFICPEVEDMNRDESGLSIEKLAGIEHDQVEKQAGIDHDQVPDSSEKNADEASSEIGIVIPHDD